MPVFLRRGARWRAWLRLSRWTEHIPFTFALTLLGINLATEGRADAFALDARLPVVIVANTLAVTFAFMINDVEDADDDAGDVQRGARNAITRGEITRREGWIASWVTAGTALVLFATLPERAAITGGLTLVLAWLYSWRGVRLKGLPVVDVVSHILMLSSLLFLAGFLAYDSKVGYAWFVAAGVAMVSAYGQLYNQVRDYEMDRAAGLRNTASMIGLKAARTAMYGSLALAIGLLGITMALGLWPLWLAIIPVLAAPLLIAFRPRNDMRGSEAIDASGQIQWGFMLMADALVLAWLIVNVARAA